MVHDDNPANPGIIIGVDIGGTKIRAGAVTSAGNLYGNPFTVPTGGNDSKETITGRIIGSINTVLENNSLSAKDIVGIGLGVTGPIDIKNGTILDCPQLPTMHDFPLKKMIAAQFGCHVSMNNDANALVLGESIWGAGNGYPVVLGFTLGTGLGCAIVINKKLHLGATEMSGEIWVSPYRDGTIEDYVSGRGISMMYRKLTNKEKSAVEIADLARKRDPHAIATWSEFGQSLAFAVAWSVNIIDPDIIVLGGSIANAMDLFNDPMQAFLRKYICPAPAEKTRVVKTILGDDAGFMGSAALVRQENQHQPA
jgi:glucokinase